MATTKAESVQDKELHRLRQELADVKSGIPFHFHVPRDGSAGFRCTSPYCDDMGSAYPYGGPPNYEPAERYARREE